jgi:hypothetical protein
MEYFMADVIDLFPKQENGKSGFAFGCDEGEVHIEEGDTPLTVAQALALLERCSIMIKKMAGWIN